eukprot:PhM_4_TR6535/c0_g1_i1/m.69954
MLARRVREHHKQRLGVLVVQLEQLPELCLGKIEAALLQATSQLTLNTAFGGAYGSVKGRGRRSWIRRIVVLREQTECVGVVSGRGLHHREQIVHKLLVSQQPRRRGRETELLEHQFVVMLLISAVVCLQRGLHELCWAHHCPRVKQTVEVPAADGWLLGVRVPRPCVAGVAHVAGVVRLEEPEWPVIDSEAYNAHVICVEHTVAEPNSLPLRDQLGGAQSNLVEHGGRVVRTVRHPVLLVLVDVGEEVLRCVLQHAPQQLGVVGRRPRAARYGIRAVDNLVGAKAEKRRREACDDGAALVLGVPIVKCVAFYHSVGREAGTSAGRGNAEIVHQLAAQVLANG